MTCYIKENEVVNFYYVLILTVIATFMLNYKEWREFFFRFHGGMKKILITHSMKLLRVWLDYFWKGWKDIHFLTVPYSAEVLNYLGGSISIAFKFLIPDTIAYLDFENSLSFTLRYGNSCSLRYVQSEKERVLFIIYIHTIKYTDLHYYLYSPLLFWKIRLYKKYICIVYSLFTDIRDYWIYSLIKSNISDLHFRKQCL